MNITAAITQGRNGLLIRRDVWPDGRQSLQVRTIAGQDVFMLRDGSGTGVDLEDVEAVDWSVESLSSLSIEDLLRNSTAFSELRGAGIEQWLRLPLTKSALADLVSRINALP